MNIEYLKEAIESSNINFLIGSGLSRPYLPTLGAIETQLEMLDSHFESGNDEFLLIKGSIYKKYFEGVMIKNIENYKMSKEEEANYNITSNNYKEFLQSVNEIILFRYNTLLNKQINIFTTNIDLFLERALEELTLEFNDGFQGRMKPVFDLSNFRKSYRKSSPHFQNVSEIPVFNVLKLHGSINWSILDNRIVLSTFKELKNVKSQIDSMDSGQFLPLKRQHSIAQLLKNAKKKSSAIEVSQFEKLLESYEEIQIVNPSKDKFKNTLLNMHHYELLRIYANELEKENTVLIVLGFSFSDEHIREITIRGANSNPTLLIIIFAFSTETKDRIEASLGIDKHRVVNDNIKVIDQEQMEDLSEKVENFTFENLNQYVFEPLRQKINRNR